MIVRKYGQETASEVSRRAAGVLDAGWPEREAARGTLEAFDSWLRQPANAIQPGDDGRPGDGRLVRGIARWDCPGTAGEVGRCSEQLTKTPQQHAYSTLTTRVFHLVNKRIPPRQRAYSVSPPLEGGLGGADPEGTNAL